MSCLQGMKICQATNGFLNEEMGPSNLHSPSTSQYQDPNTGGIVILPVCSGALVEDNTGFCSVLRCFSSELHTHSVSSPVWWRDIVGIQGSELRREECSFRFPPPNSCSAKAQDLIITTNTTIGHKMVRPFWNCSPRAWLADLSWQCIPQTSRMALQTLKRG